MELAQRLIVALDVNSRESALKLVAALRPRVARFKVGLELFVAQGRAAVEVVRKSGLPVFLDLKLHDIPQTVESAARGVSALGVDYLTVHASGGTEMIKAARRALPRTKLLAVTALTSLALEDLDAIGLARDAVPRLAKLAVAAGADGVVCSPQEVATLRKLLGPSAILVVPGIRPQGAATGDQRRTGTPAQAVRDGASILVIGRPLRDAPDPAAAADEIAREIATGSNTPRD